MPKTDIFRKSGFYSQLAKTFVVEFSPDQNCFHVQTLEDHVLANLAQVVYKQPMDRWLILFAHPDSEECFKFIEQFKGMYEKICDSDIYVDYEIRSMING